MYFYGGERERALISERETDCDVIVNEEECNCD